MNENDPKRLDELLRRYQELQPPEEELERWKEGLRKEQMTRRSEFGQRGAPTAPPPSRSMPGQRFVGLQSAVLLAAGLLLGFGAAQLFPQLSSETQAPRAGEVVSPDAATWALEGDESENQGEHQEQDHPVFSGDPATIVRVWFKSY